MGLNKYTNDRSLLVDVQDKQHTHRAVAAQLCPPPPLVSPGVAPQCLTTMRKL